MKNLIKYVFAFALSAITCAHASTWELYDSFMKLHYTDGKIVDFDIKKHFNSAFPPMEITLRKIVLLVLVGVGVRPLFVYRSA